MSNIKVFNKEMPSDMKEKLDKVIENSNYIREYRAAKEESKYIVEYSTRCGKYIYDHREVLHTMYEIYDLMYSFGNKEIHSGEKRETLNLRGDEMGKIYYPIINENGDEIGITNFLIPSE